MPTVSGFTKQRIDQMQADIIDSVTTVNGELILNKRGGGSINAGNTTGPQGDPGTPGDIDEQDVADTVATYAPGPWAPLPLSTGWASFYDDVVGPPSYRLEKDSIRFTGFVQWVNSTMGSGTSAYICDELPVECEPAYDITAMSLRYTDHVAADIRYYTNRRLILVNFGISLKNQDIIPLGDLVFNLTP